jgi:Ca2+-binding EF-hand superfamily protein
MKRLPTLLGGLGVCLLAAGAAFAQREPPVREKGPARPGAPGLRKVSGIIGAAVRLKAGGPVGKVEDLLVDDRNTIQYAVISYKGRFALVPWSAGTLDRGGRTLALGVTGEKLETVLFARDSWPDLDDPRYVERIRTVFAVEREPVVKRPPPRDPPLPPPTARKPPEETPPPPPEAVKLLRLNVRNFIKRFDSDRDGKLSRKEMNAAFDKLDANEDGFLDRKELTAAVEALAGSRKVKADARVITFFREYDVNKDGKLSRNELKVAFDRADRNRDGLLDEDELVREGARLLPPDPKDLPAESPRRPGRPAPPPDRRDGAPDESVRALLAKYDRDGDGRISRAEARGTPLERVFDRIDLNEDGFLTREELVKGAKFLPGPDERAPERGPAPRRP